MPRAVIGAVLLFLAQGAAATDARLELRTDGPTRVYLTDPAGAPVTPAGVVACHKGDEHHFVVPGRIEIDLRPGRYRVAAERGPEHRPVSVEVDLRAGERRQVELRPEHWIDMNARGWYSADLHNHRPVDDIPALHTSPAYLDLGAPASAAEDARFFLDWIDRPAR